MKAWVSWSLLVLAGILYLGAPIIRRKVRRKKYSRGRALSKRANPNAHGLPWGPIKVPDVDATRHFLAVGTTGSGKSLIQKKLMKEALKELGPNSDHRALIFDAKSDAVPFLTGIEMRAPILSLNPFESRDNSPKAVSWNISKDVTSSARALNLSSSLIPSEKGGSNQYFTDAARQVLTGVIESFIRHSPDSWTFSDLVFTTLSLNRTKEVLLRDESGRDVLSNFLAEEKTAYQVFTTIVSRMSYFRPVAALWQRSSESISLRDWLKGSSVLLLGVNSTAETALNAINEIVFKVVVQEIDAQSDSESRRTWIWIDEARLSGPLLKSSMLPYLAVKGRSRGACLVLAFQDIEGFREAATPRVAHEIISQCSYKALLRTESEESASWSSRLLGQYETLQIMRSDSEAKNRGATLSEQVKRIDAVLPSEFYTLPITNPKNGLTGYFVGPEVGALRALLPGSEFKAIGGADQIPGIVFRPESEQWMFEWSEEDKTRLGLRKQLTQAVGRAVKVKDFRLRTTRGIQK